ncbi:MAG: FHA domain-containing protein, partial [Gammaproteobacteria bacterium]
MKKQRTNCLIGLLIGGVFWVGLAHAVPQDVILVLDNSGSMRKFDPGLVAKTAAAEFLRGVPSDVNIGVIIFDQSARVVAPLAPATDEAKAGLVAVVEGMNYRGQFTDSPGAIERAIYELKGQTREGAARSIIFVSDGVVDTGDTARDAERAKWLREQLTAEAAANSIRIFPIAFTENAELLMIQTLASGTKGDYLRAPHPSDLGAAYQATRQRLVAALAETPPPAVPEPAAVPTEPALTAPVEPPIPAPTPPEPPIAAEPAPPAPEAAPGEPGVQLTSEEMAALEQLSKETGVPVEQLLRELESAPSGEAVVVPPPEAAQASAPTLGSGSLALVAVVLAAVVGGVVWFVKRGKRTDVPAGGATAAAVTARQKSPESFIIDLHGITTDPARRLTDKPVMIGRIAGSDAEYLDYFVVNKATVGRRHAIIKFKDYSYWVIDQGSVNGTYVNNDKVLGERQLKHGDRIKFHKFEFEFSYPDMADASRTVIGIAADQTIVAAQDSTMTATSASLRGIESASTIARVGAAAVGTSAWLNKDALGNVPSAAPDEVLHDVTKEGDLDSLESDRDEFFSDRVPHPEPVVSPVPSDGDDTFDDVSDPTPARPEPLQGEDDDAETEPLLEAPTDKTLKVASPPRRDFEAEASAFFEDVTVGPAPDLMKGPPVADESDEEFLDITRVPGIGDDDPTANYAPPNT